MIALDNRWREIPDAAADVAREVKGARLGSRRPLQIQNQLQRRPARAGRYKVNGDGRRGGHRGK